ncbi:MAG: alpha-glucan family phosphorylase [Fimbriimonadaceae bacterium]
MKYPKSARSFEVISELPEPLKPLMRLAWNFRWTWHHPTRELFRELDRKLFEAVGHNPVQLIRGLSGSRLDSLQRDEVFLTKLRQCSDDLDSYLSEGKWFGATYPDTQALIAYFCAEFGVSESLPIYSGGLGVLAGDHLKAASDLGLPLVGVGLLYSRGYFRQFLTPDGWQQEHYPHYDFYEMPLHLERAPSGKPLFVEVEFPDRVVSCQIWRADVGRIPLYLLDSNVLENEPTDQTITDTLYGGDEEMRIRQEMILGIGGMRALQVLGLKPSVCHMNEGHAAFMAIERIRQHVEATGCDFRTARQLNVSGNVFTTHTPVPAGFDEFPADLVERHVGKLAAQARLPFADFLRMGRLDPENTASKFNMAVLAMENANTINGVSKLHAQVSRGMFHCRWPNWPENEVPIIPITNGIHTATWTCSKMTELFDQTMGSAWRDDPANSEVWQKIYEVPNGDLWDLRENQRGDLVRFIRKYLKDVGERKGFARASFGQVQSVLDPRVLTIGFARRFASYKRATLLLADRERLKKLMFHPERPVQFVIAGKSHPRDDAGKKLIQDLHNFITQENAQSRMVFLEDYDMRMARMMVQGVDVWLNNPRRPMEASGTSGMKAVPNGVLNCSILDGWWDEAYEPGVGWAIGGQLDIEDPNQQDWLDSRTLYHLIETEIAPTFYHRVDGAIPTGWVEMMKRSIATLAPRFSTTRMVRDYTDQAYVPANTTMIRLAQSENGVADALSWRERINRAWPSVKILNTWDDAGTQVSLAQGITLTVEVDLAGLAAHDVRVEVLVGRVTSTRDLLETRTFEMQPCESETYPKFQVRFEMENAGNIGYTVRVVPDHADVAVPIELPLVTWQA